MTTTFISAGSEMFNSRCQKLHRKRSHGRLKAYASCDDVRAWSNVPGIRQRHLYDIINKARTGYGNYIPILELVKLLGVPTTGVVLAEALKKLNRISEILGETDMQHLSLTPSQLDLEEYCYEQTGRCLDADALRNLRCLVSQLYERSKDFDQVKCERDELRSKFKDLLEDESQEVLHLKTERNCLQQRLSAMEGIECRMRTMMNKYDTMLKENRELKLENSKQMKLLMQANDPIICKENEILKRDNKMLKRKIHILECNNRDMIEEITTLKCSLADQEDEISHLTSTLERITIKYDCLMEQVRYALNEFQLEITDDLRAKSIREVEVVEIEEYNEKLSILRDRIRAIIIELAENAKYPDPPFDKTRAARDEASKSEVYMDTRLRCEYFKEALELTSSKLRHFYDVESETEALKEELKESLERMKSLEEEIVDGESMKIDNESLKKELEEVKEDFRSLEKISERMSEEIREKDIELEKMDSMSREFQQQSEKFDEFKERISELEEIIEKTQDAVSLQEKLEESLEIQHKLETKEKEYMEERRSLQAQVVEGVKAACDCQKLEEEIANLKLKVRDLEKELGDKEKEITESRLQKQELERENQKLERTSIHLTEKVEKDEKEKGVTDNVLKELDECISNRKKETDELKNKINDLNSEIDRLKREVQEKDNKLTECSNELNSLKSKVSTLTDQLKECTNSKGELEGELNKASLRIKQQENEIAKGKDALDTIKRASLEEAGKMKEQQHTIVETNDKCKDLEASLQNALKELDNARREKAECEDQNYKAQLKLKDLLSDKDALEKKLNDVTQENAKLSREVDENTKRSTATEDATKDLKTSLGNVEKQLSECNARREALEKELSNCQSQMKTMQDQLNKYKTEVDQWVAKEAEWRATPTKQPVSQGPVPQGPVSQGPVLAGPADAVKAERDSLKNELNNLKNAYDDLNKINDSCQKMLLSLKKEKEELESKLSELMKNAKRKSAPEIDSSAEIAALKKQLADSAKAVADTRRKSEILQMQVAKDVDACDVYKKELESVKAQLKDADSTIDELQKKIKTLEGEIIKVEEENDNLKRITEGNRKVEAALRDDLNSCTSAKDMLQVEIDEAKKTIKEKDSEIERCYAKIKALQEEIEQVKASCQQVTNYAQNVKKKSEEIRRSHAALQDKLKAASYDVESLKETNKAKGVEADKLEKVARESSAKLQESAANCDELKRQLASIVNEKDRLAKALEEEKGKLDKSEREKVELKDQLKEALAESNSCKNMLDMMKNDNAKLLSKVDKLTFDWKTCTKEYEKCTELNTKKEKEKENLKKKIDEAMNLVKGLQTQLCQCEIELENSRSKISSLNGDLKAAREKIDKITSDYEESESTNRILNKQLEKLENHIDDLSRNNQSLEAVIKKSVEEINKQKGLLAESQNKYKILDLEFRDKQKELKTALKTINDLNSQVGKLINEIKRLEGKIEDLDDVVSRKQHEIEGLTDLISDLNFKLEASEIAKQKIEDEMTETLSTMVKVKKDLSKCNQALREALLQIEDLNLEKSSLLLEKQGFEDRLARCKQSVDDLDMALTEQEAKNRSLEDQNASLKIELDSLKEEHLIVTIDFNTLKSELEAITKAYRDMNDKLDNLEKDYNSLTKDAEMLKNKVDDLTNANECLREQKNELLAKVGTTQQMLVDCQFSVKKLEEENECLRTSLNKITIELSLKAASIAACQQEVECYKKMSIELNAEIAKLKEAMCNLNDENKELKCIIEFLKKETLRLESFLFDCRRQSDDKDYHILEITRKMNDFEEGMENYRISLENMEDMFKRANDERTKLKKEVDSLTLCVNGLEKIRTNLEYDIANCKSNLRKVGCELEQCRTDYDALAECKLQVTDELMTCKITVSSQAEAIKKIKELLNKTQKEKEMVDECLRTATDKNIKLGEQLDDIKRKLASSEENEAICANKLKTESLENKNKKNTIQCMENEINNVKDKMAVTEKEIIELKMERDCLQSDVMELCEIINTMKADAPEDTPLNAVLKKIMKCGFMSCDLTELSELHECVINATEKLVACGEGMPGPGPPAISLEPKPRPMTEKTKEFVLKLGPLHKQLAMYQQQAKKRCCALTESVQRYQHDLNALKEWDYEFAKRLKQKDNQDPTLIAIQQRASQYNQSKLAHFIAAGCKKQQEAVAEIDQLTRALERVETVQNAAINNKLPEQAVKIADCLKKKLEEACENEKKLYCLLQQEKQRAACLEYQLCKRLEPTQDQDESEHGSAKNSTKMQLEDDNNTPNKTLAEVSIPNKTLATVSNMELGKSNVNKDFLSPSRRICPPFPSLDDLTNKTAAKSKISLSGGKEKTGFNAQGTNGRNLNLGKGSNGPTVGNCGDKQSGCGVCPSNFSIECGGKKRSVSFCNKVDMKYIKPDS